jgi:hypothetical protein
MPEDPHNVAPRFVYCRRCGARIRDSIRECTSCGAPQYLAVDHATANVESAATQSVWQAVVSMALGTVALLGSLAIEGHALDQTAGLILFAGASIVIGAASINAHKAGNTLAVVGIVCSVAALMFAALP